MVAGAATLGCLLNYSMFLCTMYTSALTTTIVGVLRGVVTVLLGFLLDTVPYSPTNIFGIALNTAGGGWYSWIKYQEKVSSSSKAGARRSYQRLPTTDPNLGDGQSGSRPLLDGGGSGKLSV